jgi:hypothetical protein
MFGSSYYHGVIRKYIVMFGTMFDDIDVQRFDNSGARVQTLRIPLAYGPKEKFLVRISDDPNLDKKIALSLPRMGFEIIGMSYDSTRKLPSTIKNTHVSSTDKDKLQTQFTPVPYNIEMSLNIFVKNADDGVQILEQIFPYFTPEWTNQIKLIPEMGIVYDVPTVLTSFTTEDTYEGDFSTRRALIHTLNFTIKGYVFGPVRSSGIIKRSIINTNIEFDANTFRLGSEVEVTPGLDANNNPTTIASNSVGIDNISANNNYGFIEDITFNG